VAEKTASNEIDTITGATISSKAVANILNTTNGQWLPRLDSSKPKE
jgi:Na+-translocating ferredoxin:NAD+ oxidoreductase RnfG subunit